jgi:hypothetical protein
MKPDEPMPPERATEDEEDVRAGRDRASTKDEDMRRADRANGENPDE